MQAEFLRIWEEHHGSDGKKTVVFVTHDVDEALFLGGLAKGPFLKEFEPE